MLGTAVIIEPRRLVETEYVILNCYSYLPHNFKIVFYCGYSQYDYYRCLFGDKFEVRRLDCDNMLPNEYNDFMKRKEFWESLEGEWILVFQSDSWILDNSRFSLEYFINKNYSFVGGNMGYKWLEFDILPKEMLPSIHSFNGGFSLRKREDMIAVIDAFPPTNTRAKYKIGDELCSVAEDVYFSLGCILLNKRVGDDVDSLYFCMHTIYVDGSFGLHSPSHEIKIKIKDDLQYIYARI